MNDKIEVFDDYLDLDNFSKIKQLPFILGWSFIDHKVFPLDGDYQFIHTFYDNGQPLHKSYELLTPLINKMQMKAIVRIKANLTLKAEKIKQYKMHQDEVNCLDDQKTAIYYLNTNDGKTVFENGKEINSKANRLVVFSGKLFHTGTTHTDTLYRSVINFNYY